MKSIQISGLLFIYASIATLIIVFFDGTGGAGDSVHHYQFARYAPDHPALFFDHWAKPFYVLLASPFAQFGFTGIKVFNVIVTLLTLLFTYKSIQELNIKNSIVGPLILMFSPLCFVLTFSGLTEPLFALFISLGLYAVLKKRLIFACLLLSFLPFIRSEGLIIIGVFVFYFMLKRQWKLIPLLLFGHLVYMVAGFFFYNDFFWVFNKIPYARLSSTYGSGELAHFIEQLFYVVGVPIYILFWLGVVAIIWKSIKSKVVIEVQVIVFLGFFAFLIAHSIFWYFGIFNSMGLKRVLIGVAPLSSIIALMGFNFVTEDLFKNKRIIKLTVQGLLLAYLLIFPFTSNPAAIDWERDLSLSKDQESAIQIADLIAQNKSPEQRYILANPYLSEVLKIDHFNKNKRLELNKDFMNDIEKGDIVIWENWFAITEHGVTEKFLDENQELIPLHKLETWDKGNEIRYAVYKKK